MQAMTCVTGDSASSPVVPFVRYVHHEASFDEWSFNVLPIVLRTVQGQRRDQERCSRTLVTFGNIRWFGPRGAVQHFFLDLGC